MVYFTIMKSTKVHVLIEEGLASPRAEDAVLIAQKTKGPLSYSLERFDYDEPTMYAADDASIQVSYMMERPPFSKEELEAFESRPVPEVPAPTESLQELRHRMRRLVKRYRIAHDVEAGDHVIVLTTTGNFENFMVLPGFEGEQWAAVQLNHRAMSTTWSHTLLAYYLMALPVMLLAYADQTLESYLAHHAHTDTRGCLNDLCADDVRQLQVKTKTADICRACKTHFQRAGLDWDLVAQMRHGFELVRAMQLNLEDVLDGFKLPEITLGRRPQFVDLGVTVPLSPKEMAVYLTFMEAGVEGIVISHIDAHRAQLHDAYSRLYNGSDRNAITEVIDRLLDLTDHSLTTTVSKLNRKFTTALGRERARPYQIHGPNGGAKAISLPRRYVLRK